MRAPFHRAAGSLLTSTSTLTLTLALTLTLTLTLAFLLSACGSDSPDDVILSVSEGSPEADIPINLRHDNSSGGDYSGKVVVKFKDGTDVRLQVNKLASWQVGKLEDGAFVSLSGADVRGVNEIVQRVPLTPSLSPATNSLAGRHKGRGGGRGVTNISRVSQASEEEVDGWREYWAHQGVQLHDWNLYYYLDVPDYEDAVELVNELNGRCVIATPSLSRGKQSPTSNCMQEIASSSASGGAPRNDGPIDYAEILPVFYLTVVTTPDFSEEQGYLKSAALGGLGVEDAWAKLDGLFPGKNLRGQNSMIVDHEFDWNFDHEILPIDETSEYLLYPSITTWGQYDSDPSGGAIWGKNVPANINHGTAVMGIIAGQGDLIGAGVNGIASASTPRVASISKNGILGPSSQFVEGGYTPIGSIYIIEVQQKGITTTSSGCGVGDGVASPSVTGCVPIESDKYLHAAIRDSASTGRIVVIGAGNGSVDLNDDNKAAPIEGMGAYSYFTKPENDSGSIMVGASLGADRRKAAWSNCGDRVDLFAWGAGVVTSGYGDKYNPDGADPNVLGPMGADNPRLYTGQFGGTSAATAQIGGIAALIQSYVRALVDEAGYNGKVVYLDSKQMRQILKASGQPAVYGATPNDPNPNCNIGVQPDASTAIDKTNEFLNAGNIIKIAPLRPTVVSGIRYDMDGDGRAELISFSRDHKFYIDLSSQPPVANPQSPDGYGEWDIILTANSQLPVTGMLFPVVHDYNSDGRADLALYDSINGKWYIKYSGQWLVVSGQEEQIEWDRTIDYSSDPLWKPYSRPVPGDYNGDRFLDIALQTPDGHWLIDYGGFDGVQITPSPLVGEGGGEGATVTYLDRFGSFDKDIKYLTDEQLAEAPGWAWLALGMRFNPASVSDDILIKTPDSLSDENRLFAAISNVVGEFEVWPEFFNGEINAFAGDNSEVITAGVFFQGFGTNPIGIKKMNGEFQAGSVDLQTTGNFIIWPNDLGPSTGYGDIICYPSPADYDGDGKDDRTVQCGSTWKVAYSSQPGTMQIFELGEALDPLPAYIYPGGIKYKDIKDIFQYYKLKLPCLNGSNCNASSTISEVIPPIGPYFNECIKYWAPNASYCWVK